MTIKFEITTIGRNQVRIAIRGDNHMIAYKWFPDKERALEWAAEFIEAVKSAEIVDLDEVSE